MSVIDDIVRVLQDAHKLVADVEEIAVADRVRVQDALNGALAAVETLRPAPDVVVQTAPRSDQAPGAQAAPASADPTVAVGTQLDEDDRPADQRVAFADGPVPDPSQPAPSTDQPAPADATSANLPPADPSVSPAATDETSVPTTDAPAEQPAPAEQTGDQSTPAPAPADAPSDPASPPA